MISDRVLIHKFVAMTDDEILARESELWDALKQATVNHDDDTQADVYKELNMIREYASVKRMLIIPDRVINETEIRKWYGMKEKGDDENPNLEA